MRGPVSVTTGEPVPAAPRLLASKSANRFMSDLQTALAAS
jgi:hypothetical protein